MTPSNKRPLAPTAGEASTSKKPRQPPTKLVLSPEEIAVWTRAIRKHMTTKPELVKILESLPDEAKEQIVLGIWEGYEEGSRADPDDKPATTTAPTGSSAPVPVLETWRRATYDLAILFGSQDALQAFVKKRPALRHIELEVSPFRAASFIFGDFTIEYQHDANSPKRHVDCKLPGYSSTYAAHRITDVVRPPRWMLGIESHAAAKPIIDWMIDGWNKDQSPDAEWRGAVFIFGGTPSVEMQRMWALMARKVPLKTPVLGLVDLDAWGLGIWKHMVSSKHASPVHQATLITGDARKHARMLWKLGLLVWFGKVQTKTERDKLVKLMKLKGGPFAHINQTAEELHELTVSFSLASYGKGIKERFLNALHHARDPEREQRHVQRARATRAADDSWIRKH